MFVVLALRKSRWEDEEHKDSLSYAESYLHKTLSQNTKAGPGEMASQSRAYTALPEDMGLIPSIQGVAHSYLSLQFQGIQYCILVSESTGMHVVQRQTSRQNIHTQKFK